MSPDAAARRLPRWESLRTAALAYVRHCDGDDNADPDTNGESRVLRRELPGCRVVFDIGANVGDWAARAIAVNPAAQIHCFEPCRATFERLRARGLPQAILNNCGLAAATTHAPMFVYPGASGHNSLHRREALSPPAGTEVVQLDTFDRYLAASGVGVVDFAKIDVEGHEVEVLRGMTGALSERRVRVLQFEYGGTFLDARIFLKDVFAILMGYGYSLWKVLPDRVRSIPAYTPDLETFRYQNWLAVAPGHPLRS